MQDSEYKKLFTSKVYSIIALTSLLQHTKPNAVNNIYSVSDWPYALMEKMGNSGEDCYC
jgi:hypothetical protein